MQSNKKRYIPREIDGIFLLDKPEGLSSNQALQRVKHYFQAKKAGHTGSLDPLATGMLPICLGEATKFSHFLLNSDKAYETTAKLGIATTTGDAEGDILRQKEVPILSEERVQTVLRNFLGDIIQIPPIYSALKHEGRPLYELARKGIKVEPKQRVVHIYSLKLIALEQDKLTIRVHCSKGTYIRSLMQDIAEALNTVGHVQRLKREWVHPFQQQKQYGLNELFEFAQPETLLLPIDAGLSALPTLHLTQMETKKLQCGQPLLFSPIPQETAYRLYNDSQFLGVGEMQLDGVLRPKRLVVMSHA